MKIIAALMIVTGFPVNALAAESPPAATGRYAGYTGRTPLPRHFASRTEAGSAGCLFGNVKGPGSDNCVLGAYESDTLRLLVYDKASDGTYAAANELNIPSQYWDTKLSLADMQGRHTDWLIIETTGMHGTGIGQRVLLVIAWHGDRFRVVAAESLDYHCQKPPSPADYALHVRHEFKTLSGEPGLLLDYELTKGGRLIGKWSDQLRWSRDEATFIPNRSKVDVRAGLEVGHVLSEIERVRSYVESSHVNPANGDDWMVDSELMDVLAPACSPSLLDLARDFRGKWILDDRRTTPVPTGAPVPVKAPTIGADREGLHIIWNGESANGTSERGEDLYRLDGKAFPLTVRLTDGKQAPGTATAVLDGEKMVVTITVDGWRDPLRRVFYRDGQYLVIEESGGASGMKTVAYYTKA